MPIINTTKPIKLITYIICNDNTIEYRPVHIFTY